jgi:hypothetical protein
MDIPLQIAFHKIDKVDWAEEEIRRRVDKLGKYYSRLIGARVSPRSVRYQCPSNRPSRTAPRTAAPAKSWRNATPHEPSAVPAIAPSIATASGAAPNPPKRADVARRTNNSTTHNVRTSVRAIDSRSDHAPASSPVMRPAETEMTLSRALGGIHGAVDRAHLPCVRVIGPPMKLFGPCQGTHGRDSRGTPDV